MPEFYCDRGVRRPASGPPRGRTLPQDRRRFLQYSVISLLTAMGPAGLYPAARAVAQDNRVAPDNRTASGKPVLWISASNAPPYSTPDKTGFEDRLFTEIFRRLGIEVRIYDVPSQRGLSLLNEGKDDGTLARNAGMAQRYPNLVQFSEKALDREYLAYTKRPDIEVSGWDSLAGYSVGIVNGWKILEQNITKAGALIKVRDGAQLFRILEEDRVDLVVFNRWGGLYLLRELGLEGVKALEPPLARREVFFYLHKRHAALAERASEVLRQMKQDGSYQQLVDETLGPLTS